MQRGNPYGQGNPVLPYKVTLVNEGADCWGAFRFLDRSRAPAVPLTIVYRIDNVTDNVQIVGNTSVTPSGTTIEINVPGALNVMSRSGQSSQINQMLVTSTYADNSRAVKPFFYEIIGISTVGGA
jgi:hypothetical protein